LKILISSEVLPCVAAFNQNSLCILAAAELKRNEVILREFTQMFCFFSFLENCISGAYGESEMFCHHPTLQIQFSEIVMSLAHRYIYQDVALDIFTTRSMHITVVFKECDRRQFLQRLSKIPRKPADFGPFYALGLITSPRDKVAKSWISRELSTYDYLMYLNTLSSRSFNDLAQYPVFPWVLGNFTADHPVFARDLTKPMGAQTQARAERFVTAFLETHLHYGTHYSHPAAVLHYMMRVEPFTIYNIDLHKGLDHRDRQFSSIAESWKSASESNQSDVKELIPEFYVSPYLFENPNSLDFESRTDGLSLNQVLLPTWAKSTIDFVWKMRIALEASDSIEHWIDLIFGYKQRGQAAIEAMNVYHRLTYSDDYDFDSFGPDVIDTINQFGQCPTQLFTVPHEPRQPFVAEPKISSARLRISQLRNAIENCWTIRMQGDVPCFARKLEHFIGPTFVPCSIFHKHIVCGKDIFASVDACKCSTLSRDGNLLAVVSFSGVVLLMSCLSGVPRELQTIIVPAVPIEMLCISIEHGLICAWNGLKMFTIDCLSGFFIREIEWTKRVVGMEFDELNNFVIVATRHGLQLFALDLRIVAQLEPVKIEITSVASGDGHKWQSEPMYATGHVDGTVRLWYLENWCFREAAAVCPSPNPISSLLIIALDKAILAVDSRGCAFSASVEDIRMKFLRSTVFEKCAACGTSLRNGTPELCSNCGLAVCKQCSGKKPIRCTTCSAAPVEPGTEAEQQPETEEEEPDRDVPIAIIPSRSEPLLEVEHVDEWAVDLRYRDDDDLTTVAKKAYRHTI
jgi:hypothetical protein